MSAMVMKPLLVLTPPVELLPDEEVFEALEDEEEAEEALDEVELLALDDPPDATEPDPGLAPTVPLTVITVAATGEVRVQLLRFVCAVATAAVAVVTAAACWLVLASAWFSEVWALVICCWSFNFVLASEFSAWVTADAFAGVWFWAAVTAALPCDDIEVVAVLGIGQRSPGRRHGVRLAPPAPGPVRSARLRARPRRWCCRPWRGSGRR